MAAAASTEEDIVEFEIKSGKGPEAPIIDSITTSRIREINMNKEIESIDNIAPFNLLYYKSQINALKIQTTRNSNSNNVKKQITKYNELLNKCSEALEKDFLQIIYIKMIAIIFREIIPFLSGFFENFYNKYMLCYKKLREKEIRISNLNVLLSNIIDITICWNKIISDNLHLFFIISVILVEYKFFNSFQQVNDHKTNYCYIYFGKTIYSIKIKLDNLPDLSTLISNMEKKHCYEYGGINLIIQYLPKRPLFIDDILSLLDKIPDKEQYEDIKAGFRDIKKQNADIIIKLQTAHRQYHSNEQAKSGKSKNADLNLVEHLERKIAVASRILNNNKDEFEYTDHKMTEASTLFDALIAMNKSLMRATTKTLFGFGKRVERGTPLGKSTLTMTMKSSFNTRPGTAPRRMGAVKKRTEKLHNKSTESSTSGNRTHRNSNNTYINISPNNNNTDGSDDYMFIFPEKNVNQSDNRD